MSDAGTLTAVAELAVFRQGLAAAKSLRARSTGRHVAAVAARESPIFTCAFVSFVISTVP